MRRTLLTVVLSTTGRRLSLRSCLESVSSSLQGVPEPTELLVVHNAAEVSDELRSLCAGLNARYVQEPMMGLSIARNRGILEARGELVAFVDDDIFVSPGWASTLVRHFQSADVEAVTGRVLLSKQGAGAAEWHAIYGAQPSQQVVYDQSSGIPFAIAGRCGIGNNMAFRTAFLLRYGLFDPLFGLGGPLPGGEEIDRFHAVLQQDKKILYAPDVCVEHAYPDDKNALYFKIQGFATAQMGFFTKCLVHDSTNPIQVLRYVLGRARVVLTRRRIEENPGQTHAPRNRIILGSLLGPWVYLFALLRERLWPSRELILPQNDQNNREQSRLLMILYNSGLGGAETVACSLATSLKMRMRVYVIVPSVGQTTTALHRAQIPIGFVPRERLRATLNPFHHLKYLMKFPGTVTAYRRTIRHVRPDLVHVDNFLNLPALVAARFCKVRTLLHLQQVPVGFFLRSLASLAGTLADRVVAVSNTAVSPMRGRMDEKKVTVVYNGTRFEASEPRYNANGWVSFVGRLSEDKDPILFVRAAERVFAQQPDAKFMICGVTVPGRKRYEAELFRLLKQADLPEESFTVFRDREDVRHLLRGTSVVVNCSSVPESFGLAVLEAMAQAIPVIAPRSGAFPEILVDRETVLLYEPGNLEELADCILQLLRDPALAERIGLAGWKLARNFYSEEEMASAMEEQYRQLWTDK